MQCAVNDKCMFFKDKTLFCPQHVPKSPNPDMIMTQFNVYRRVYVNRDEHKQLANMIHLGEQNLMRIGGITLLNIGQLLPHQLQAFHTPTCIYPVGFKIVRFWWSCRTYGKRCTYTCSINDNEGVPEFVVDVDEAGLPPLSFKGATPREAWLPIVKPVVEMHRDRQAIKVFLGN